MQILDWQAKPFQLGTSSYSSIYFVTTGLDLLHWLVGIGIFLLLIIWTALGYFSARRSLVVTVSALYWYFVTVDMARDFRDLLHLARTWDSVDGNGHPVVTALHTQPRARRGGCTRASLRCSRDRLPGSCSFTQAMRSRARPAIRATERRLTLPAHLGWTRAAIAIVMIGACLVALLALASSLRSYRRSAERDAARRRGR